MITSNRNSPAHGIGDPIIWSLLICAFAVTIGAFILLRNRNLEPVSGFGGAGSDRGFPPTVGDFDLRSVRQSDATETDPLHLTATYQRGMEAPIMMQYFPVGEGKESGTWMAERAAAAKTGGASELRGGSIRSLDVDGKHGQRVGGYVLFDGGRPGEPSCLIWTQPVADRTCGFVLIGPGEDQIMDFRRNLRKPAEAMVGY